MPVLIEQGFTPAIPLNHARIGYNDAPGTYTATSAAANSPAVAAKSWQTFERWRPTSSPATLTKVFDSSQRIDYIGIGAATLSIADSVTVELLLGGEWQEVELQKGVGTNPTLDLDFAEQDFGTWEPVPDNEAVMLLLTPRNGVGGVRVTVEYSGDAPSIGKLAAGEVLTMHRPFYQGHSPATLAADVTRTPSVSQGGEWLGNTIIRQGRSTQMSWQNLPAPWVRRNLSGLIEHAVRLPFFVAWNPLQFRDCLYAQSEEEPQKPSNSGPRDLQSWSLDVKAYSDGSEPVTTPVVYKDYADIVTHTRDSEATYWDESGVLRTAGIDEPRFTHDPVTGEALWLLVEGEGTNRIEWSEDFVNSKWAKSAGTTVVGDAATAPDGTLTADRIERSGTGTHAVQQNTGTADSGLYTLSFYAKQAEQQTFRTALYTAGSSGGATATFDVAAGTVSNVQDGSDVDQATASIEPAGNGWYRCTLSGNLIASGSLRALPVQDADEVFSVGDAVLCWGAQVEAGASATSYIKTTSTPATRAPDLVSVGQVEKWLVPADCTMIFDGIPLGAGSAILGSNEEDFSPMLVDANGNIRLDLRAAGGAISGTTNFNAVGDRIRAVVLFRAGEGLLFINGELAANATYTPSVFSEQITEILIGTRAVRGQLSQLKSFFLKALPHALTESDAIEASKL